MLRAAGGGATPRLIAASAVAVAVTGTVAETAAATVTIPAGAMGTSGAVEIRTVWSNNNSAGSKTFRVRFGGISGTIYLSTANTTAVGLADERRIRNRGSSSSQIGHFSSVVGPLGATTVAIITSAVNTDAAVDVVASVQLASGTDTGTLESYEVWLLP